MCAASVRFSRHRFLKTYDLTFLAEMFSLDARQHLVTSPSSNFVDHLQTLSVLSLFETTRGAGFQAWHDISKFSDTRDEASLLMMAATASSLLRVVATDLHRAQGSRTALTLVERYVRAAELLQSLGQRTLKFHAPGTVLPMASTPEIENTFNVSEVLISLLSILLRIQHFSDVDYTKHTPAPWALTSTFMSVRHELDRLSLFHGGTISFNPEDFENNLNEENGTGEHILCSLTWHCCVVMLNRIFLPIQLVSPQPGDQTATTNTFDPTQVATFPTAPRAFLQERITTCINSANSIARICSRILSKGVFFLVSTIIRVLLAK